MKTHSRLLTIFAVLLSLIGFSAGIGYAAPAQDRVVVAGEIVETDLNILDDLDLEAGSVVAADVNILGGDAIIAGTISGNLVVFGGDVYLMESAVIEGDCVIIGGKIDINGSDIACTTLADELDVAVPNLASLDDNGLNLDLGNNSQPSFWTALFTSIFLGVLALGTTSAAPRHIERISDAITVKPVASGTVGALTFVATVSAIAILGLLSALLTVVCVGLLGVPVVLAMSVLLIGAGLIGWVSIGKIVGEVLRDALHLEQISLPVTAALGTSALSFAIGLIGLLPAVGFSANIAILVVGGIGLGATALTRFGTRNWPLFAINIGKEQTLIKSLDDEINLL